MKKLLSVFAIATVLSLVVMGCTPPVEGDTAPAPETPKTETKAESKTDSKPADSTTAPAPGK